MFVNCLETKLMNIHRVIIIDNLQKLNLYGVLIHSAHVMWLWCSYIIRETHQLRMWCIYTVLM